ncbi:YaiI/YqxD family protein [Roseomonas sp. GC11]|uniref:YaiI/YqxD family protein n=1 Tax=Roseomonas sp. GC11 TaxID=2950546 RepID=UPI0021096C32|nr:YaiI/YqxD family protein [Roseomonas sp. GC11]MCQ4160572.1 YaiI/YqxD family protein [Roseomonas sp. GC11]
MSKTEIWIDADACPVREEVFRVAGRLGLVVHVVSNGARGIRLPEAEWIRRVIVPPAPDAADDHIAAQITPRDLCVTADIPLAARCLEKKARALSPTGRPWTSDNIGQALAGREVSRHLRELGVETRGRPMAAQDRARFLSALENELQAALRDGPPPTLWRPVFDDI